VKSGDNVTDMRIDLAPPTLPGMDIELRSLPSRYGLDRMKGAAKGLCSKNRKVSF
jgi:hypothetical protein